MKSIDDLKAENEHLRSVVFDQEQAIEERIARIKLLEDFIIDSRGSLPAAEEFTAKAYGKLSEIMPGIVEYAQTITRGNGSAANYENQFRHAEYRAKLVKENLRNARHVMRQMIVSVASVADRTHNQVFPSDIKFLRGELDKLAGYQEIVAVIDGDPFLDGVMPELNKMEGTGHAERLPALRLGNKGK